MMNWRIGAAVVLAAGAACGFEARAQVDQAAEKVLKDSAGAIEKLQGVTYKSQLYGVGALKDIMDGEGEVKQLRVANYTGKKQPVWIKGAVKELGKGKTQFTVATYTDPTSSVEVVDWVDDPANTHFRRNATDRNDAQRVLSLGSQILLTEFIEAAPFGKQLKAQKIELKPNEQVRGTDCQVVMVSWETGLRSELWWIGAQDHLPRKIEMAPRPEPRPRQGDRDLGRQGPRQGGRHRPRPPDPRRLQDRLRRRPGAAPPLSPTPVFRISSPPPRPPSSDCSPAPRPPSSTSRAPTARTSSSPNSRAASSSSPSAGASSPRPTPSTASSPKSSRARRSRPTRSPAVRNPIRRPSTTRRRPTPDSPLLLGADTVRNDYRVVGFPFTYVLTADGRVSKGFQGPVSKEQLEKAVDAALKGEVAEIPKTPAPAPSAPSAVPGTVPAPVVKPIPAGPAPAAPAPAPIKK